MSTRSTLATAVSFALVVLASSSAAQSLVGALAVDERQGVQWGWTVDHETVAAAREAALRECGAGCSVVLTFERCGAYAADQANAGSAYGLGKSHNASAGARQRALTECRSRGGSECLVRAWGCNAPVVEEELGLDRATRRLIQQGLRTRGHDPGGADGLFGPRTRAAIRDWQAARGVRPTGYLNNQAAGELRTAGASGAPPGSVPVTKARPQAAGPAAPPAATAEQENLFWQSIAHSTDPADFEAYLEQFPNGVFRRLAENRLSAPRPAPTAPGRSGSAASAGTTEVGGPAAAAGVPTRDHLIDFGDDGSEYARDDECDDVRFDGPGMAGGLTIDNRGHDAADCRRLFRESRVHLFGVDLDSGYVDFGDDASNFSRDGECDDPRFEGDGMATLLIRRDRGHDATDCRRLYNARRIRLFGVNIGGFR